MRPAPARERVLGRADLVARVRAWQAAGETVVLVDGTFELLQAADARSLATARARGTRLVAVVCDDPGAGAGTGAARPLVVAADRALLVAALRAVDAVAVCAAGELPGLLVELGPVLRVRGSGAAAGAGGGVREIEARLRRLHGGG